MPLLLQLLLLPSSIFKIDEKQAGGRPIYKSQLPQNSREGELDGRRIELGHKLRRRYHRVAPPPRRRPGLLLVGGRQPHTGGSELTLPRPRPARGGLAPEKPSPRRGSGGPANAGSRPPVAPVRPERSLPGRGGGGGRGEGGKRAVNGCNTIMQSRVCAEAGRMHWNGCCWGCFA